MQQTLRTLFSMVSTTISLYTTICFIRIILSWIPNLEYSKVGRILSSVCDPYLNLFRRIPLRILNLDFSPALAIGSLTILTSIFKGIAVNGVINIGGILSMIIYLIWSLISSFISLLLLFLVIRFIALCFSKNSNNYYSAWGAFDNFFSSICFKISNFLFKNKQISYKNALLTTIIILVLTLFLGKVLCNLLSMLLNKMPI